MKKFFTVCFSVFSLAQLLPAATSLTQNHITWTFDKDYPTGQFINGDYWVLGPVKIVGITNTLHEKAFEVSPDVDGSMINPIIPSEARKKMAQGYDVRLTGYDQELNAALPNGKPIEKNNPLALKPQQSLMSAVSWLWRSDAEKEAGCPKVPANSPQSHVRATLRAAAVLTCLDKAPPEGSFRPAYCGDEKKLYNLKDIKRDRLLKLDPIEILTNAPANESDSPGRFAISDKSGKVSVKQLATATQRVWLDHIPGWYGGEAFHPTINLPNYGREICYVLENSMLALLCDWEKIEGSPSKDPLLINMLQIGIDLTGAADNGGFWMEDGGHCAGRKPAILFAGLLLDDKHMIDVGNWKTQFQDNTQVFYVSENEVLATNGSGWAPDRRGDMIPYTKEMIGMPEWGIAHGRKNGLGDNAAWKTPYRGINNAYIPGFALTFLMMDARKLFNHEVYFDYADRVQSRGATLTAGDQYNRMPRFAQEMWTAYRSKYPSTYDAKKWDSEEIIETITKPKGQ